MLASHQFTGTQAQAGRIVARRKHMVLEGKVELDLMRTALRRHFPAKEVEVLDPLDMYELCEELQLMGRYSGKF